MAGAPLRPGMTPGLPPTRPESSSNPPSTGVAMPGVTSRPGMTMQLPSTGLSRSGPPPYYSNPSTTGLAMPGAPFRPGMTPGLPPTRPESSSNPPSTGVAIPGVTSRPGITTQLPSTGSSRSGPPPYYSNPSTTGLAMPGAPLRHGMTSTCPSPPSLNLSPMFPAMLGSPPGHAMAAGGSRMPPRGFNVSGAPPSDPMRHSSPAVSFSTGHRMVGPRGNPPLPGAPSGMDPRIPHSETFQTSGTVPRATVTQGLPPTSLNPPQGHGVSYSRYSQIPGVPTGPRMTSGGLGMPTTGPPMSGPHPHSQMPASNRPPIPRMPVTHYPGARYSGSQYPGAQYPDAQYAAAPSEYAEPVRHILDPDQAPDPIQTMNDDQRAKGGYFDTKEKGLTPPLVSTKFIVHDGGNASPRYIRSTMYTVPTSVGLINSSSVPFGIVVSPFALIELNETEPPFSDSRGSGPVRCVRCKAYMCPFMKFINGGRKFQCAFCKATTDVPEEYFQHLDYNGLRLDFNERPELHLGAYEVKTTKEYCRESKEPNTPGIIFAIDVSYTMINNGVVQLICENMKSLLKNLPRDAYCDKAKPRVGFLTYDSKVHFYNLHSGLHQPQQLIVGDVADMFFPLFEGFWVNVKEAETLIDSLVKQIPLIFGGTRETETMLGPVIQAGKEAFKAADCAGKLIIFHQKLPTAEAPGMLNKRNDRKVLGTEKEKSVLMPQNNFYNELGQECVGVGCSVDLFLFNTAYIDIPTLSQICRLTGGQVYKYTHFQAANDGERFLQDLKHNLSRPTVFDAVMRVRTSTGVRPVDFFGSFYMPNTTDVEVASMNSDSTVVCEIKHDDNMAEEDGVYIQTAVLFTSCSGQRRLRILNLALNTSSYLGHMYTNCELDTIINFTAKQSISKLMKTNPSTVKENLISNCANILVGYKKICVSSQPKGELCLPGSIRLLPLYTNCLLKSDALIGGADIGCDDRAYLMSIVSSMDVKSSAKFFYPRLFPIHDVNPFDYGYGKLPDQIRCTMEKIKDSGVYLLENGIHMLMYIGMAVDPNWVKDVFGVESTVQINMGQFYLHKLENPVSKRVNEIIDILRNQNSRYQRLVMIRQRDKLDGFFRHHLMEDGIENDEANFKYLDFLCHMHKEIRMLLKET